MTKIDFKTMKSKVGIDDVAYHLGYRIDKKAGLGKFIEMVLPNNEDKIIIKNPQNKANQTYFRRDGRKGGDVISFIQENLTALGYGGKNQWEAVIQVLADFSNTHIEESQKYIKQIGIKGAQVFDPKRYDIQPVSTDLVGISRFLEYRGLNMDTLSAFSAHIVRLKDLHNTHYDGYNIAFPYTRPSNNEVVGYEVRGYKGFKSKAAGTDSSNAAWIVDLSLDHNPLSKKYVYFFESAFDSMAFYQANKARIDLDSSVFVSIGGTFSENQIKNIMNYYRNATAVDCYDNDIAGKIYGIRMLAVLNDATLVATTIDNDINLSINGITRRYTTKELTPSYIMRCHHLSTPILAYKAPGANKDWNDVVLQHGRNSLSKYDQSSNLKTRRLKR